MHKSVLAQSLPKGWVSPRQANCILFILALFLLMLVFNMRFKLKLSGKDTLAIFTRLTLVHIGSTKSVILNVALELDRI